MTTTSLRPCVAVSLAGLYACSPGGVLSPTPVLIDGEFNDWAGLPAIVSDPAADVPEGVAVDLGDIHSQSDGHFLYFALETGREVNAQAMHGRISVLLDADADARTGETLGDLHGVDLVLELSRQDQLRTNGYGSGIGVRTLGEDGKLGASANAGDLDVIVAPTAAARRFEMRLRRGTRGPDRPALLSGHAARAQVIYEVAGEGGGIVDRTTIVDRTAAAEIELAPLGHGDGPAPWSGSIGPAEGDVRVVVWNVASEGFRDRAERFARILGALTPDIVLLDEVFGDVTPEDVDAFFARAPLRSLGDWQYVLGRSGGRQKTLVASRIGIRAEPALENLPYRAGSLDALEAAFPDPLAQRLFALERERGLASVGAWVDVGGLSVLFVPIDLQSAGFAGSFEDELRKLQAATLRDRVAGALTDAGEGSSAVIGGDLNLVGSRDPLEILSRALDIDGADLVPADARRLTDRSYATWRNRGTPFTPGRLDYVLVPMQVLEVTRAFAFDANELSDTLREALGIMVDDPTMTSDHLPIVADLARRGGAK